MHTKPQSETTTKTKTGDQAKRTFKEQERYLSIKQMCEKFQKSRVTIWRWVNQGFLPQPLMANGRTIGWRESVIADWTKTMEGE